jgi:hypothetical protein
MYKIVNLVKKQFICISFEWQIRQGSRSDEEKLFLKYFRKTENNSLKAVSENCAKKQF